MSVTVEVHTGVFGKVGATATLYADQIVDTTGIRISESVTIAGCYLFTSTKTTGIFRVDLIADGASKPFWYQWINFGKGAPYICVDSYAEATSTGTDSGTCVMTVNVKDQEGENLQTVIVDFQLNGNSTDHATTDSSGNAVLSVAADATYNISARLAGYSSSVQTGVVITESGDINFVLTQQTITPSTPDGLTGYLIAYDEAGDVQADIEFEISLVDIEGTGRSDEAAYDVVTSNSDGVAEKTKHIPSADYKIRRLPGGAWIFYTTPSSGEFELPNCRP